LSLTDRDGSLKEELPPITQFLNRLLALTIAMQNTLFEAFEALLRAKIEGAIASGSYDRGVETIVAESLRIVERRTIYTHAGTTAETQVFTILRRDRNEPLTLAEALELARERGGRLLINAKSHRAAVQIAAPSLMLDDGQIERRVRLLRPMERTALAAAMLGATAWEEADNSAFSRAWQQEFAEVPTFTESQMYVVTGLLLPIWRRLPNESCRVYRLQTDDGERVIGRQVSPTWVAEAVGEAPTLALDEAWSLVFDRGGNITLADGLSLRRTSAMGAARVELEGFSDGMLDRLKAMGLVSEIIAWKLRLFVPIGTNAPTILATLLGRYPLVQVSERKTA
jgi:hypothetical protein